MNISIIVPVYKGEKTLRELYSKIKDSLVDNLTYEIIFVYDCGKDNSWNIIKEFAEKDQEYVRGFHLDKNYGQQNATLFGLRMASGDSIITLDEDNQHDPKYIPEMISELEGKQFDFVYGKFRKIKQPFSRVFLSLILRRILCIMIPDLPRDYSSFRVIRKDLAVKVINASSHFSFIDAELGKLSSNYGSLLINHCKRLNGNSSYTISKLFRQSLDVLFRYSRFFRIIFSTFLVILFLSTSVTSYLTIIHTAQLSVTAIISFVILLILVLIRRNSNKRINHKLNPEIIKQIYPDK